MIGAGRWTGRSISRIPDSSTGSGEVAAGSRNWDLNYIWASDLLKSHNVNFHNVDLKKTCGQPLRNAGYA